MRTSLKAPRSGYVRTMRRTGPLTGILITVVLVFTACNPGYLEQKSQVDAMLHEPATSFAQNASNADFRAEYRWLDFTTDGCSNWFLPDHLNDTGVSFDFTAACWHHDFGYRNYKRFNRAGILPDPEASRQRIDDMFRADMLTDCAARPAWMRPTCASRSSLYYFLARGLGEF